MHLKSWKSSLKIKLIQSSGKEGYKQSKQKSEWISPKIGAYLGQFFLGSMHQDHG